MKNLFLLIIIIFFSFSAELKVIYSLQSRRVVF
jgi:hypothetical protein